ncbi:hypothetical protein TeGR_g10147 [Tetraparma gracilis]|uniref:Cyclic nucleotide-binding domain-containing protein n=1 Tax=Tetraparma gracilis TaxID=2962635 RepID=A0ABQ6MX06_9STRA|nr:hypothetical protein TeGR_g10147 [Tetraparma gracilis]
MAKKSVFDETSLVMKLPPSIRTELVMEAYQVDIDKLRYFKTEDDAYVCHLMLAMKPLVASAHEMLLEQGDIVDEVIFLLRGTVRIVVREASVDLAANDLIAGTEEEPFPPESPCLIGIVSEGGYFGDLGLRAKTPRLGSFEAVNICQMLSVSRTDLEEANHAYVLSGQRFVKESETRLRLFRDAKETPVMLTPTGQLCYTKMFVDGELVEASSVYGDVDSAFGVVNGIRMSASSIQAMRQGSGLQQALMQSDREINLGRRRSTPTISLKDLHGSDGSSRTPSKSFKTRRQSISASPSDLDDMGLGPDAENGGTERRDSTIVIEEADETAMDLLRRGIIVPDFPMKVKWDMFIGALIVFSVIVVPYRLGFDVPPTSTTDVQDLVIDMLFWMDLFISFRSAYEDAENDILVTVPREIAKHYVSTWFFVDFFSVFPIAEIVEFIVTKEAPCLYMCGPDPLTAIDLANATALTKLAQNDGGGGSVAENLGTLKLLKVVRLVRLLKLVRLMKLGNALEKIEEEFSINPAAFELFKLLLQVTFIAHMFGCFFFFVSVQTTEIEDSWYYNLQDTSTIGDKYVAALYWAFTTMTTVGYGDITPSSVPEMWYGVIIMMLGATVFGYILANIATLMGQLNARESKVNANIRATDEFLSEKNIGKTLQKNIKTHIRFALSCSSVFDEYSILQKLPTTLGRKLFFHNHRETIKNICVFNHIRQTGVTMYVFAMLHPAQYADGHTIFKEGDIPNDIYFIYSGRAEIIKLLQPPAAGKTQRRAANVHSMPAGPGGDDGGRISPGGTRHAGPPHIKCADVKPGEIVGYMGLIGSKVHPHSCVARTSLSVYYLNVHDLANTVFEHPFVAKQLQVALGKSIHEQNETFRRNAEEQRDRKFKEIMMAESNVLAMKAALEDPRLAAERSEREGAGEATAMEILTPKYQLEKAKMGFSWKAAGAKIAPGGAAEQTQGKARAQEGAQRPKLQTKTLDEKRQLMALSSKKGRGKGGRRM